MNRKRLIAIAVVALCLTTLCPEDSSGQRRFRSHGRRRPAPTATADITAPTTWPNLDVLSPFKGWHSKSCGLDGAGQHGSEKGKSNQLKNRYHLPDNHYEEVTYDDLMKLNQGRVSHHAIVDFPTSDDPNNQRAVKFTGYVISATPSGCTKHFNSAGTLTSQGESCNCNTIDKSLCDAHIEVIMDENASHKNGHGVVVVEVTERVRRLAAMGLLKDHNNIGKNWSTSTLQGAIVNKWVTFYGYLFYDEDHVNQAWVIDPDDTINENSTKGNNFRETAWEIHPVMGIEVLSGPPPSGR